MTLNAEVLLAICLAATGCGTDTPSSTSGAGTGSTSSSGSSSGSSGAGLDYGSLYKQATWGANVTVTYADCELTYKSNGVPNHARNAEYALPDQGVMVPSASSAYAGADPTVAQSYSFTINTCPSPAASTTSTSLGAIGVMISGAALFNPYEGNGSTVALASNFYVLNDAGQEVWFVDGCNGHPTPMGTYHYHGLPDCVTAEVDTDGGPSHIIGIAFDGYPIYGAVDLTHGELTENDLDACNGITSPTPEFPDGGVYHYVLLNTADSRSSIKCFTGTKSF